MIPFRLFCAKKIIQNFLGLKPENQKLVLSRFSKKNLDSFLNYDLSDVTFDPICDPSKNLKFHENFAPFGWIKFWFRYFLGTSFLTSNFDTFSQIVKNETTTLLPSSIYLVSLAVLLLGIVLMYFH